MKSGRRIAQALVAAALIGPRVVHAQVSGTFTSLFTSAWITGWTSRPAFPDGGGTAVFPPNFFNSREIALSAANVTLSNLIFDSTARFTVSSGYFTLTDQMTVNVVQPSHSSPGNVMGHAITARLLGTGALVKEGPGVLAVGTTNTHSGGTTIRDGTLIYTDDTSFGSGSVVLDGGTLLGVGTASYPLSTPIHIGPLGGTLATPYFGTTMGTGTIASPISGDGTLRLVGQTSDQDFYSYGFNLTGASTFGGILHAATNLALGGSMNSIQAAVLSGPVRLGSGSTTSSKLADAATITLSGGAIIASSASGTFIATETVGNVIIERGLSILGDDRLKLSVQGIERTSSGILSIGPHGVQISGSVPALVGSGAPGTPEVGIVPWARLNEFITRPVTVDETGLMRPLNDSEFINSLPVGVTASNFRPLGGSMEVTNPITVNSLTLGSNLTGAGTVTVTSGAVFITIGSGPVELPSRMSAPLNFGATEGILHTRRAASASAVIDAPISGTGGLIISGYVAPRGASTYTGPTTITGRADIRSDVYSGIPGPLGADVSPVVLESSSAMDLSDQQSTGQLLLHVVSNPITFGRDLIVRSVDLSYAAIGLAAPDTVPTGPSTLAGNIQLEGNLWLSGEYGIGSFVVSGDIQGPGRLVRVDDVILTGNNSFAGGVIAKTRSITAGSNTAFGAGTLWITGNGTISSTGSIALNNPVVVQADARIGGSQRIGFSGPVDLFGGTRTIELTNSNVTAFSGTIFNGSLVKTGSGTMEVGRVNVSTFTIRSGAVRTLPDNTASVVRLLSIAPGASLDLTNNAYIIYASALNPIKLYLSDFRLYSSIATPGVTTIGYGLNSVLGYTTFDGQPVAASTATLLKYTYFGDANLDGMVDARDLLRLANGWLAAGSWVNGDFSGDGMVNQADLTLLAKNWQAGDGAPLGPALDQLGLPSVEVPEPAGIACAIGLTGILRRRRR